MKTRMIAVTAAILLAAASLMPLAGAETADAAQVLPNIVTETVQAGTSQEKDIVVAPASDSGAPAAAEQTTEVKTDEPELKVADVKTHHRFQDVAARFKVKIGRVSPKTRVCMWTTDCRKANTKLRPLAADETLTVVAQSNGWYKVVDSQGVTGFVVRSRVAVA